MRDSQCDVGAGTIHAPLLPSSICTICAVCHLCRPLQAASESPLGVNLSSRSRDDGCAAPNRPTTAPHASGAKSCGRRARSPRPQLTKRANSHPTSRTQIDDLNRELIACSEARLPEGHPVPTALKARIAAAKSELIEGVATRDRLRGLLAMARRELDDRMAEAGPSDACSAVSAWHRVARADVDAGAAAALLDVARGIILEQHHVIANLWRALEVAGVPRSRVLLDIGATGLLPFSPAALGESETAGASWAPPSLGDDVPPEILAARGGRLDQYLTGSHAAGRYSKWRKHVKVLAGRVAERDLDPDPAGAHGGVAEVPSAAAAAPADAVRGSRVVRLEVESVASGDDASRDTSRAASRAVSRAASRATSPGHAKPRRNPRSARKKVATSTKESARGRARSGARRSIDEAASPLGIQGHAVRGGSGCGARRHVSGMRRFASRVALCW